MTIERNVKQALGLSRSHNVDTHSMLKVKEKSKAKLEGSDMMQAERCVHRAYGLFNVSPVSLQRTGNTPG